MNSWTPENITALVAAVTALIGVILTAYHTFVTRGIANNAKLTAVAAGATANYAKGMATVALKSVSIPGVSTPAPPPETGNTK